MLPHLLPGRPLDDQTVRVLQSVASTLANSQSERSPYEAYFAWVNQAATQLRLLLTEADLNRLVLTAGFRLASTSALTTATSRFVLTEVEARRHQWEQLMADIKAWRQRWVDDAVIVVPDTNVYVHHAQLFDAIDWRSLAEARSLQPVRVVLPMVILDELDGLKRKVQGKDAKEHLRHALHEIARRFERPHARSVLVPADDERLLAETTIEVFLDDVDHIRLTRNDTEIADRARCLADVTCRPVCIVTNDNGMATRARMLDLLVKRVDYPSDFA